LQKLVDYKYYLGTLGTPLHQPEEDQMILPNALQQQQQQPTTSQSQQVPPLAPMGALTPTLGLGMGMSMPHTKYVPGFALPITSIQSQTPVRKNNN
jgi:transcription initiation factor TFIID TATA-box-binding protein